jgi:ferric iron reductase protein FhuF
MSGPPVSGAAALAQAARIGPFFRLLLDPDERWTSFAEFAADDARVAAAIADARTRLATSCRVPEAAVEPRTVASLWHLGLAAELASPALGAAALAGWVPRLDRLRWGHEPSGEQGRLGIRVDDIAGTSVSDAAEAAGAVNAGVVKAAITPLTETVARVGSVSELVVWGNVWSVFAGAATVVARERPYAGGAALSIVRAIMQTVQRPLPGGYDQAGRFRRDTCCLYYRLPRGGLCGDCVLDKVPSTPPERA